MIHIETPVQVCDSEIINLYYVRDADGDRVTTKITLEGAREIVATLNERDNLIAQRDALVEVCRAAKAFIDDDADPYPLPGGYTLSQMKQALCAALDLVKGEQ